MKSADYLTSKAHECLIKELVEICNAKFDKDAKTIVSRLNSLIALNKHKYIAKTINTVYEEDYKSDDDKKIYHNGDWKENALMGRGGPVEDSSFVHCTSQCAVYGSVIKYVHPIHKKVALIEVAVFSRAVDKISLAAMKLEDLILDSALKR